MLENVNFLFMIIKKAKNRKNKLKYDWLMSLKDTFNVCADKMTPLLMRREVRVSVSVHVCARCSCRLRLSSENLQSWCFLWRLTSQLLRVVLCTWPTFSQLKTDNCDSSVESILHMRKAILSRGEKGGWMVSKIVLKQSSLNTSWPCFSPSLPNSLLKDNYSCCSSRLMFNLLLLHIN